MKLSLSQEYSLLFDQLTLTHNSDLIDVFSYLLTYTDSHIDFIAKGKQSNFKTEQMKQL